MIILSSNVWLLILYCTVIITICISYGLLRYHDGLIRVQSAVMVYVSRGFRGRDLVSLPLTRLHIGLKGYTTF